MFPPQRRSGTNALLSTWSTVAELAAERYLKSCDLDKLPPLEFRLEDLAKL
jgi:hypothetical protein